MAADKYTIAWLCALTDELVVAKATLDLEYDSYPCETPDDHNKYTLGRIGRHNVVICCLPEGIYGTDAASSAVTSLRRTFRNVKLGLLVGIGGAVFSPQHNIRIGDVAVSVPGNGIGGVLQHDFGKHLEDRLLLTRSLNKPPAVLLNAVSDVAARHCKRGRNNIPEVIEEMMLNYPALREAGFSCTDEMRDSTLNQAVVSQLGPRKSPQVHYGLIASGNQVIRNPAMRDWLAQIPDVICVEMEAAGVMDILPCLVIRGISDFADSSKDDQWKRYAAATAAAYAKELLDVVPQQAVEIYTPPAPMEDKYYLPLDLAQIPVGRSFVGRDSELSYLRSRLLPETSSDQKVVILHGQAGIGKTQLAIRFAIKHKNEYSAIIWLNAKTRETLCQSLGTVFSRLPNTGTQPVTQSIEQQARAVLIWLSMNGNTKFLLIYDNFEQYNTGEQAETNHGLGDQISDYLPSACHGSIIITTRNMRLARTVRLGQLYLVKRLDPEESIQLLMDSDRPVSEPQNGLKHDFLALANRLDGLPLALVIARAFIQSSGTPPAELLKFYANPDLWGIIHQQTDADCGYTNGNLIATLRMLYEEIKRRRPSAARLLLLLSCYDNRDIWYTMICNGLQQREPAWMYEITANEVIFRLTIAELLNFGLVEAADSGSYSMHPVVQDWCRHQRRLEGIENDPSQNSIGGLEVLALRSIIRCIPSKDDPDAWILQRRLLPHASQVIQSLLPNQIERYKCKFGTVTSLTSLIPLCERQKDEETLRELSAVLLASMLRILGPTHATTICCLVIFGILHIQTNKELAKSALIKAVDNSTGNSNDHCLAAQALAVFYIRQKAWVDAESLLKTTLDKLSSESHVDKDIIYTLGLCLGLLYAATKRFTEMESIFLKMAFDEHGALHSYTACLVMASSLGNLYTNYHQYNKAESMYHQAVQACEIHLGLHHYLTLHTTHCLGEHYSASKRHQDAIQIFQRVLGIYEKLYGADSTHTLNTKMWIAFSYVALQRQDAHSLLEQVAEDYIRVLGPRNAKALDALLKVGLHFLLLDCFSKAEATFRVAHTGYVETLGWDHHATIHSAVALSSACWFDKRVDEAAQILEKAIYNQCMAPLSASTPNPRAMFLTARLPEVKGKREEARVAYARFLAVSHHSPEAGDTFQALATSTFEFLSSQRGRIEDSTEDPVLI
ncbi:hypothetical protein BJX63DRAFT_432298 [Aspergillus granulosus]|uniref:Nucleoside phosphorylase domain-containing protein n=1 Tax=Aspergillus granulosus TaxID=176169 RepID=A0ABR4HC43_9EURO